MKITNVQEHRHLTTTERKAIIAILEAGLDAGKVGKKTYRLTKLEKGYKVTITQNQTNMFNKMVETNYTATFEVA